MKSKRIAIINTNLGGGGKLQHLSELVSQCLIEFDHEPELISLNSLNLPACDGYQCYQNDNTKQLTARLELVDAIIVISPIYNYDLNAAAKNLIELTGSAWKEKAAALVCMAGGERSYLSPLGFMNSLAIDYRCLVSPRFVYANRNDFTNDGVLSKESSVGSRIRNLALELPLLADAAQQIALLHNTQS